MFYLTELEKNAICCELRPGKDDCDYLILEELDGSELKLYYGLYAYSAPIALYHYLRKRFPHISLNHPEIAADSISILKDLYRNWYVVTIEGESTDTDIRVFNDGGAIGYYIPVNGASFKAIIC